jgi:hypothetical protein
LSGVDPEVLVSCGPWREALACTSIWHHLDVYDIACRTCAPKSSVDTAVVVSHGAQPSNTGVQHHVETTQPDLEQHSPVASTSYVDNDLASLQQRQQSHSAASTSAGHTGRDASKQRQHGSKGSRRRPQQAREFVVTEKTPIVTGATGLTKQLKRGSKLYVTTQGNKQLHHCLETLTTARQLMLARSDTGIALQPVLVSAATTSSPPSSSSQPPQRSTSSATSPASAALTAQLHIHTADESCLRKPETRPLLCARRTSSAKLSQALVARLTSQGFTRTLSLGPISTSIAITAITEARKQLRAAGEDLVVLPGSLVVLEDAPLGTIEYVDYSELVSWEEEEQEPGVSLVDLRVVRCIKDRPWQLQPFPVRSGSKQRSKAAVRQAVPEGGSAVQEQEAGAAQAAAAAGAVLAAAAAAPAVTHAAGVQREQQQEQAAVAAAAQPLASADGDVVSSQGPCSPDGCCKDTPEQAPAVVSSSNGSSSAGSSSTMPGATRTYSNGRRRSSSSVAPSPGSSDAAPRWQQQQQGTVMPDRQAPGGTWRTPVLASAVQQHAAGTADAAQS